MRTLRVAMLALSLAALVAGCGKKKDPAAPAPDTATETTPAEGDMEPVMARPTRAARRTRRRR